MIRLLFIFLFCVLTVSVSAQGVWTWIKGDTIDQPFSTANRGQLRVPSATNLPEGASSQMTHWTDGKDNLWIMQTYGGSANGDTLIVWRYHIPSNTWTWMAGHDSLEITGAFSASVKALYRASLQWQGNESIFGNMHWSDTLGNFWMMTRIKATGDIFLSRFNIQTYQFEIIDHRTSNYSSRGSRYVSSLSNFPNFVSRPVFWVRGENAFIYSGEDPINIKKSTELWQYNMKTNLWTWLGGGYHNNHIDFLDSFRPKYAQLGISSPINWPGYRQASTNNWIRNDKLYLFGGNTVGSISNNGFQLTSNDLWYYDLNTNLWTWSHGSKYGHSYINGIYPSQHCIDSIGIHPSGRYYMGSIAPIVCDRVFWMFGGNGTVNISSELWMYRPDDNQWIWVDGEINRSRSYHYGQKGVPSVKNNPPPNPWFVFSDSKGSIYTYGTGERSNITFLEFDNELWRYDPDYSCVNYRITDKFIDRGIRKYICLGDSTAVNVLKGYDSLRIIPMTDVTLRSTATVTEVWLKPSLSRSYKIIAYGYRCESYLDSLTVPIVVAPPGFGYDTVTICEGQSVYDKTTTGNYTIKITNPLGCDSTLYLKLTVLALPRTLLDTTVCEGATVQGHTTSGTYRDTFIAASGCDSIYTLRLTVIPKRLPIDTALCLGSSIAGYNTTGIYYDTLTSPQGCITYRVIKLTINYPSSSFITQTICQGQSYGGHTTTGTYLDTLRNVKGCDSVRTLSLIVKSVSRTTINQNICIGTSYLGRSQTGTYKDTFQNSVGCDSIQTLILTVRNPIILTSLRDTLLCYGYTTRLDAGSGHRSYLWSTAETSASIVVSKLGLYRLAYEDNTGCKGKDSAFVSLRAQTTIQMVDTISNYKGEVLNLSPVISPSPSGRYRWSPSAIFSCDTCRTVRLSPNSSLTIKLEYTDVQGCKVSKDVVINIYESWAVGFPAAFSPNNDTVNDLYFPNTANILSAQYSIYNRWGEKVFQSKNMNDKWDGIFNGKPLPNGIYSYYAEIELLNRAKRTYTGELQIVR
jgi:gliding motility-associated-like protein